MTHTLVRAGLVSAPSLSIACLLLALFTATSTRPLAAQDSEAFAWDNTSELSFVSTGGNAASSTLGLKAALTGSGNGNTFKFEVGGIRAESEFRTRTAVGTEGSFQVREEIRSEVTAESYFAKARYERDLGKAFFFAGSGWDRNTFAGVQNRFGTVAGLGAALVEGDSGHLKADLGATYTIQKDVSPAPGADEGFGGLRFSIDASRVLSETATLGTVVILDENLENTDDLRADWQTSLTVSISQGLALKTSFQLLFDNLPASVGLPLETTGGAATGVTVPVPGNDLDRIFTLTLVIKL